MPKDSNQNVTRIIILGLLCETDMSGYDILNHVTKYFHPFTRVSPSSVYYLLEKLDKEGLVKLTVNGREDGRVHSRKTHSVTKEGRAEFSRLITETSQMRFHDPVQLALVFFDYIDDDKRKEILESRIKAYERIDENIKKTACCVPEDIHNKYFHLAMTRGKAILETDRKILKDILKKTGTKTKAKTGNRKPERKKKCSR